MAMQDPFQETFLLSIWLEGVLYGLYSCLFCTSVYIILQKKNFQTVPSRVMFGSMLAMFFLATMHLAVNLYRLLRGYVWLRDAQGGPAAYFDDLAKWDHMLKFAIYVTETVVGDALVIYRCWIVWDKNYYIIAVPFALLVCTPAFGSYILWLYTNSSNVSTAIFNPRLHRFIATWISVVLSQNIITTSLIAYRIWRHEHVVSVLDTRGRSSLIPIARIMVESAAIYVLAELILLILYSISSPWEYIALESVVPIIGIVFALITVRLAVRSRKLQNATSGFTTGGSHTGGTVDVPLRPMAITITRSVHKDMEDGEGTDGEDRHTLSSNKGT